MFGSRLFLIVSRGVIDFQKIFQSLAVSSSILSTELGKPEVS